MAPIPFPLGSYPGRRTHESAGRLVNAYAEPLGPGAVGAAKIVSSAGLLQFTATMLNFDTQEPGADFTLHQVVTGATSGAHGEIIAQDDAGETGTLQLSKVFGTFIVGETITTPAGTPPAPLTPGPAGSAKVAPATPLTGYRGAILVGSTLYAAFEDTLVFIDETGTVTKVPGSLPGTDRVQFSRNNKQPVPDVVATIPSSSYLCSTSAITAFTPPGMSEVTNVFMDGYTFYADAFGTIQASQINDAATFNALDVTTAQAKAGQLRRLIAYDQHLFAMCETWIEVFRNTANPEGFPFSRVAVINRGLIAPYAVAGYQDGFGKALVWVGDDNGVHILDGYTATRISTPDVDRDIEALGDKLGIEANCYITSGAAFVSVSSAEWTWEFNLTTQQWNERRSKLKDGTTLDRWRGTGDSVFAFEKWLIGDTHSGKLHEITSDARMDDDAALVMRIESAPTHDFPRGLLVPRADFNCNPGTGRAPGIDPIETDPQVMISWSDDGGLHWSNPLWRGIGRQDTNPQITILRTGRTSAQGRRWALEISDPVYFGLLGGDMTVERQVG